MAKDYAKYNAKKRTRNKTNRGKGMLFVFLLLALTVGMTYWVYVNKHRIPEIINNVKLLVHHKKAATVPVKSAGQENAPAQVHFAFYNELPNMQMPSTSSDSSPAASPPPPKSILKEKNNFVLQLGEFQDESEASQTRLSLLLLGIESDIVKVGEMYKLQQGSYATLALAKASQKKLQKKGVEATIQKN